MKKMLKSVLASLLVLSLLVACGGGKTSGATIKLGVASTQHVAEHDGDHDIEFTTVVVGVALKDDKVSYIRIDESQQFSDEKDGILTIEALPTKKQRGADYGMKDISALAYELGMEWDEQIKALEEALVGKTLDEVKAYFGGEEVLSAATIILTGIEATVIKAIESAVEVEGVAKVGLGYNVATTVKNDGLDAESVLDYAMVAVDADGKIVKVLLDNAQEKAKLVDGKIDFSGIGQTKGELKDKYNMIVASPIGKEWNEQNDALMDHFAGKTLEEILAYDADASVEDDLKTTVTMVIAGSQAAIKNAFDDLGEIK